VDRGNGRIYRVKLRRKLPAGDRRSDPLQRRAAVQAQLHQTIGSPAWRLVLSERHQAGRLTPIRHETAELATNHPDAARRLRAVWSLHAIGAIDAPRVRGLLRDDSEYVRAWAVQLGLEALGGQELDQPLQELAGREPSLFVRRYLASAIQRVSPELLTIATVLSQQPNASDRDLPLLLWIKSRR
jgi:hypothetical protein